jgi:hypothetical protein
MFIELRLPQSVPRQWHLRLAERLAKQRDVAIWVNWISVEERTPPCVELLFSLERLVFGLATDGAAAEICPERFERYANQPPRQIDLTLDLCGPLRASSTPTWTLTFDGSFGEPAAIGALLGGISPAIEIIDVKSGSLVASARAGSASASLLGLYEDVLNRVTALVVATVEDRAATPALERSKTFHAGCAAVARLSLLTLMRLVRHRLYVLTHFAPHWRVGWRFVDGPDVIDLRGHPPSGWRDLPDDGFHFYADPFPVERDGRTYLFVEDYDHRLGHGVISVAEFDDRGPLSAPQPVFTRECHLSYPFVFEHEGEMWMVPETSSARSIDLYRAEKFPGGWRFEANLVEEVEASDATLFIHGGQWWMMATVREYGGSFDDALHLWSAPRPQGPWTPHRRNPVLVDIGSARPAGRVVQRGDSLIRPVQDCRGGYGAALGLATITRLDADVFEQRVDAKITPGALWPGRRLHTLNRAGRLECIDGSANSPKLAALWRNGEFFRAPEVAMATGAALQPAARVRPGRPAADSSSESSS